MEPSSPGCQSLTRVPAGPSGDLSQASPSPLHTSPPLRVPDPPHHQVAPAGPAGPPSTGPLAHSQILKPEDAHHSPCLDMPLREPGSGKEGGRLRAWRHRLREEASTQSSWQGPLWALSHGALGPSDLICGQSLPFRHSESWLLPGRSPSPLETWPGKEPWLTFSCHP